MKCSVVVTEEQARDALLNLGEMPFQHLMRRFKEEHSLSFTEEDFKKPGLFITERDKFDRAFRFTYTGEHKHGACTQGSDSAT